LQFLKVTYNT